LEIAMPITTPVVPSFAKSRPALTAALAATLGLFLINGPALGDPMLGAKRPAFGWPALVKEARKYIGTNPTSRKKLWCATFMNMVLARTGYAGTGSDAARSFASYGKRINEPRIGAIAVLTRGKRGGHVGVVTGIDGNGNPIIISGNHGKRVGVASYSRKRVIAYVMPVERAAPVQVASAGPTPLRASDADQDGGFTGPIEELLAAINAERDEEARAPVRNVERAPARRVAHPAPAVRPAPHRVVQQVASADIPLPRERMTPAAPLPRSRPQ
jgi:uncharacterized protein (TIGR02594 family)